MVAELAAAEQRAQDQNLLAAFSLPALLPKLPLRLPAVPGIPPSPKPHYRSHYCYLGYQDLLDDPARWQRLSPLALALRLIDFSALEAPLAHFIYRPSPRGQVPFHPVSLFLLASWHFSQQWPRTKTIANLDDPDLADYRQRFGFQPGCYPTEGGLRYFEQRLGEQADQSLIAQTFRFALRLGCIAQEALRQAIISLDGMIHDAASRLRCSAVTDTCYQPAPRPCPAKDKGHQGCDCTETACAVACQHATPRDPQARFIVYQRHNQDGSPNAPTAGADASSTDPGRGEPRYGYRSLAARLVDPVRRNAWVVGNDLGAANAPEDKAATTLLQQTVPAYPEVEWAVVVADAGEGREPFLSAAYDLHLRRVVGLRADPSDRDRLQWTIRGYDNHGTPVCPFGFRLHPNGWDDEHHRHKWCCQRTCERECAAATAAPDCAYRTSQSKHGLVRNVGRAFADGSTRLVRDFPFASPAWKSLYGRGRNAAEERNSELESWGLKRMPVFGWGRVRGVLTLADMWVNLNTVIRLLREAVLASSGPAPPPAKTVS